MLEAFIGAGALATAGFHTAGAIFNGLPISYAPITEMSPLAWAVLRPEPTRNHY